MNCAEAEQFFDAYLDGELSGSMRLEFDAHRLHCPLCQQKLAMMEACEHIISRDGHLPELPADFGDRVMEQIERKPITARRHRRRRLMIVSAVALQVAAVIVFAVVVGGLWRPEPPAPAGPAAAAQNGKFLDDLQHAIDTKDREAMFALITNRASEMMAARSNLEQDVSGLARFAASSLFDEVFSLSDAITQNPLGVLLGGAAPPGEPEKAEPAPGETNVFSL